MEKPKFFSLAEMKQPVNQWICFAFFGIFLFWLILYYATEKAQIVGGYYSNNLTAVSGK